MEHIWSVVRPYGVVAAGACTGAGWWMFMDALVVSASQGSPFAWRYVLPGLVATLGVVLLGAIGGSAEQGYGYYDEGEACRGKCVLFIAYVVAFGSIGAASTMLLLDNQHKLPLWPAASATIQSTVLAASGLLLWLSRGADDDGYAVLG